MSISADRKRLTFEVETRTSCLDSFEDVNRVPNGISETPQVVFNSVPGDLLQFDTLKEELKVLTRGLLSIPDRDGLLLGIGKRVLSRLLRVAGTDVGSNRRRRVEVEEG